MAKKMALTIEETDDTVIIRKDGIEIDIGPNHSVVVHIDGPVKVQPPAQAGGKTALEYARENCSPEIIKMLEQTLANDVSNKVVKAALEVGDQMQDGSIFAGISPDTGKQLFAMLVDAPLTRTFNGAAQYAKDLNARETLGHDDWRVPTKAELNVLFNNRAAIGNFDISGSSPSGWYWSGTPFSDFNAYCQRFSDGKQYNVNRINDSSVRCVR
jgi:hypothetical protein